MHKLTSFSTFGKLIGGKILFDNRKYWDGMLAFFEDCYKVKIIIERVRGGATQAQYGYLYGHLYPILSAHTGQTVDYLDRVMKSKFLTEKVVWRGGEMTTVKDKHECLNDELWDFIMSVYDECIDMSLMVELPDPEWRVKRDFQ